VVAQKEQKITETYKQNELFEISMQFLWISADYFLLGSNHQRDSNPQLNTTKSG
jgi:hypothetical protein